MVCLLGIMSTPLCAQDEFAKELEQLAVKCEELGLRQQAEITRAWIVADRPDQQVFYPFQNVDHYKPAVNAPQLQKYWYERFSDIRKGEAERLYQQACQLTEDLPQAYRLLHRVLHENHRHLGARKILGYSDSTVLQLRPRTAKAKKAMPVTGWRSGEYFTIKTTHFEISTNASAADGVRLAKELEQMYSVWQQAFVEFWCDTAGLKKRIAGENGVLYNRRVHSVILFDEVQSYQHFFQQRGIPNQNSSGFYNANSKTSYLHPGKLQSNPWVHEVAHQLFYELGPALQNVGSEQNIWAIEGIAIYMESLQNFDRYVTLGGFESGRLQYGRYNALVNQFHYPLDRFVELGNQELTSHPDIAPLYSQCSGLAHFLMDGNNGKYRDSFFELLRKIYTKTDSAGSLAQLTRTSLEQLSREYHEFLLISDQDLDRLRPGTKLKVFCAARGDVTDKGLARLKAYPELTWLDATGCPITDESIPLFRALPNLVEVTLDGSGVTDATVRVLAELKNLEQLDLANTQITDQAIGYLAGKPGLEVLFLTNTSVTDKVASDLETMVNLIILDLAGTRMSDAVVEKVKSSLTKLK